MASRTVHVAAPESSRTGATPGRSERRITPNVFAISFGIAGVAEGWSAGADLVGLSSVPGNAAWLAAAAAWLLTGFLYGRQVVRGRGLRGELLDPVFGPFVALVGIVPMLCGVAVARHDHAAGTGMFAAGVVVTVVLGGWLTGQWILSDMALRQWHPGYFLPTVAGGLLSSASSSALGYQGLARAMFGYGTLSWFVLGSILLQRMFVEPRLPGPLLPTMAIQLAPPVVAGVAWFQINGERPDAVAWGLLGYAALMGMVQLRLVPLYRTVPFGPGWWAFAFSYAAVAVDAVHWLAAEHVPHAQTWALVALSITSLALLALLIRTLGALLLGRFLPSPSLISTGELT